MSKAPANNVRLRIVIIAQCVGRSFHNQFADIIIAAQSPIGLDDASDDSGNKLACTAREASLALDGPDAGNGTGLGHTW